MFKMQSFIGVTVPVSFIENQLPKADGTFVKIYLYGYMLASTDAPQANNKKIAQVLDVLETDVTKAWKYWEKQGLVSLIYKDDDDQIEMVEFLNMVEGPQKKRPQYLNGEVALIIEKNSEMKSMYQYAEEILGKTLSSSEIAILYGFYDWLRLPVQVILILLEYCVENGKKNLKYIEKVAMSWAESNINTIQAAKVFVGKKNTYSEYKKLFEIKEFSESEVKFIEGWIKNFDYKMIAHANQVTKNTTGKVSLAYTNGILNRWLADGIKSVDMLKALEQKQKQKPPTGWTGGAKKTAARHINYTQKGNYNIAQLEQMAMDMDD